ncbi:hypothetical protein VNO80_19491 [Phaseolus coccineus]|uniref:Uncharacterized protein n=1 Tax=Phaseolus coccineus TaxID=3886 RepID=A0AAN9QXE0_PHACN
MWRTEVLEVAVKEGVSEQVRIGSEERSRLNGSPDCCIKVAQIESLENVKDLGCFREVNVGSSLSCLASREVEEINEKVSDLALSPVNESNLVDVRVVQADLLVQKLTLRTVPIFMSNSAIENCNRIYRMTNEEFEAVSLESR